MSEVLTNLLAVLVVHGCWLPGQLALWAEEPALPLTTASRARVRPHPFAVSSDTLLAALEGSSDDVRDALAKDGEASISA